VQGPVRKNDIGRDLLPFSQHFSDRAKPLEKGVVISLDFSPVLSGLRLGILFLRAMTFPSREDSGTLTGIFSTG
jgi:hypothetical protein